MRDWLTGLITVFGGPVVGLGILWIVGLALSMLGPVFGVAMSLVLVYRFLEASDGS